MRLKVIQPETLPCGYCGARPGEKCTLVLAPEIGELSVRWNHNTRLEAAA